MKKKGFTLIELLAVIVILAIIALIVTPIVADIIKSSRKSANARSVEGHIKNIEYAVMQNAFNNGMSDLKNTDGEISDNELRLLVSIPENDKIYCETLALSDGIVIIATGCRESSWTEEYTYEKGIGAYVTGEVKPIINPVDPTPNPGGDGEKPYVELSLNGADPVITGDLVPVTIESNGTVKKADIMSKWYNYEQKEWANAVILKDSSIDYAVNDVVPENNIDAYFVWIPRYKYKLFEIGNHTGSAGSSKPDTSNKQAIEIVFESKDTAVSSGSSVGDYITHPAFISFDVNGIWVGKFEIGGSTSDLDIKPNVKSLVNVSVGGLFTSMYGYKRDLDSHMIKNTEWGAVAYLSLSAYGINDEVRINNNSQMVTGCAATVAATTYMNRSQSNHTEGYYNGCENAYNTNIGYLASTTGNITGVYDLSGGAWEYVAGYIDGNVGSSGLTVSNYDSKYFDVYSSSSALTLYNYRILGDATGETGPFYYYKDSDNSQRYHNNWFADYSYFVDSSYPWFRRGGDYGFGVLAGQLSFNRYTGAADRNFTSRIVLAP